MDKCREPNCDEDVIEHHVLCLTHHDEKVVERKKNKKNLIDKRLKDPFYIDDSELFIECAKVLIPLEEEDEDDSEDEPNAKFWMECHMHQLLFVDYYDQELSRTNLLIQKIKELHYDCCKLKHGFQFMIYDINRYKTYSQFLVKWIEGSKIIEKNKLVKNLDMVDDVQTIVNRILTNL